MDPFSSLHCAPQVTLLDVAGWQGDVEALRAAAAARTCCLLQRLAAYLMAWGGQAGQSGQGEQDDQAVQGGPQGHNLEGQGAKRGQLSSSRQAGSQDSGQAGVGQGQTQGRAQVQGQAQGQGEKQGQSQRQGQGSLQGSCGSGLILGVLRTSCSPGRAVGLVPGDQSALYLSGDSWWGQQGGGYVSEQVGALVGQQGLSGVSAAGSPMAQGGVGPSKPVVREYVLGDLTTPAVVAQQLFVALRVMDELGVTTMVVEGVPEAGEGLAVMNRLRKAASQTVDLVSFQ